MKTVIITGANRGIGLELARQYHAAKFRVIACCRHPAQATELKKLADLIIPLDVTKPMQIESLPSQLKSEQIDVLINNAGVIGPENQELDIPSWLNTFHTNTIAPYTIAQALASKAKVIVNLSSVYGSISLNTALSDYCAYRSSKAALNAATKCLAHAHPNTTIIVIHPGSVNTDMNPDGRISVKESVEGIRHVIANLTPSDTGKFFNYLGAEMPW